MLRNFKNDKIFLSAKFQFSAIDFVKVISNKPFFLLEALDPGLKLLELDYTSARRVYNPLVFKLTLKRVPSHQIPVSLYVFAKRTPNSVHMISSLVTEISVVKTDITVTKVQTFSYRYIGIFTNETIAEVRSW